MTFTPTDATNYNTVTQNVNITVTKANPIVNWPTGLTAIYGQTLGDISLPGNGTSTPAGTFTWTAGNTTPVGTAGTQTHNMTFTPTDVTNYNTMTQNVNITVSKADPTVNWPTGLTAIYGETLGDISLPGNGTSTPAGTFTWTAGNTTSVGAVGTQTHNMTFTPTDVANYNIVMNDVSVIVSAIIAVSANPAIGGAVSGGGIFTYGTSVTVTAIPAACYNFVNWTEGGTEVSTDANYIFTTTASRTLVANFELKTYTITATSSAHGTLSPSILQSFNCGANPTFTYTPDVGYEVESLLIDGVPIPDFIPEGGDYTFVNLTANHTIEVRFIIVCPTSVTGNEGIEYPVVRLSGICWTAANLRNRTYNDAAATPIPFAKPYYNQLYPNAGQNEIDFGLLYDYASVFPADPALCICPDGWRLPTIEEWIALNIYSANDLKNPTFWLPPNSNTNATDMDIRAAGYYNSSANRFEQLYGYVVYWSSSYTSTTTTCQGVWLSYYCPEIKTIEINVRDGVSVRCVMNR
jgi:uncharacterized protein (TIGR02145 family)